MKIISEDQAVETRTSELLFEWEKGKPVQGNVRPDVALNNLAIYEGKFSRLKEDRDNVARAKEALELMEPGLLTLCKSDIPSCPLYLSSKGQTAMLSTMQMSWSQNKTLSLQRSALC